MSKAKLSPEQKIELVELWLSGGCSQIKCAQQAGISKAAFQHWVRGYRNFGSDYFYKTGNHKYSAELKQAAVSEYLQGNTSQNEICEKYSISSVALLYKWIRRAQGREKVDESLTQGRRTSFEERLEIVKWCLSHDRDYTAAARKFNVSYNQLYYWVGRYEAKGEEALKF